MVTENILRTSVALKDVQSKFTASQWDRALLLINSSEMLKAQIRSFERDIEAMNARALAEEKTVGAASFTYAGGISTLTLGTSWFESPEKFVGVLAHELGHYVNRQSDFSGWNKSVAGRNPKSVQRACLSREGYAFHAI
jgi:hypothetical protein